VGLQSVSKELRGERELFEKASLISLLGENFLKKVLPHAPVQKLL
jgi:hypothetical protein